MPWKTSTPHRHSPALLLVFWNCPLLSPLSVAFPWLSVQPEECSPRNNGPPSVRPLVLQVKENVCASEDTRANQISEEDGADSGITSG
ncbi:hypothetical protein AVEN_265461-1 [Araneus ventricosus]|uniref:Secreted protein n=1 Tax=Araneus ventricosus TaxID=182803 RepID=A0A4Y2CGI2_ARAVE|nr:hypothetical protein AVEN_265461-1 [Araneus ventricosus]